MITDYISKIKHKTGIFSSKKTGNVLDGSYISVYKGNSQNFEDLREYIPGDNVRDIDWKASSRNSRILVRRYIAEKKHNILLVFDTSVRMKAYTEANEPKKDVAIISGGLFGYIASKNGDNVGAIYNKSELINYFQLKPGIYNIERILAAVDSDMNTSSAHGLQRVLEYIIRNIKRRMILLIITDENGINAIPENILKKLKCQHDILFVSVGDARMFQKDGFSVNSDRYIPEFFGTEKKLIKLEEEQRNRIHKENEEKLKRLGIVFSNIDKEEDAAEMLSSLLERHKYAGNR